MSQPLRRRTSRLSVAAVLTLLLGSFAAGAPAHADELEDPIPLADVVDVEISPSDVDVSKGPVDVTVRLSLADNESEDAPELAFLPEELDLADYHHYGMDLIEGTETTGTWESTVTFPADTAEDTWTVLAAGLTSNDFYLELGAVDVTGSADGSTGGPGVVKRFTDVTNPDAYYYHPVQWMVANQIAAGYQDGTFKPFKPVTRGEAVTFLFRYAGEEFDAPTEPTFRDVPLKHHQFEAISWASETGVVNGYGNEEFRSGKNMTRGEVAAILYRWADPDFTVPATTRFSDVVKGKTSHYDAIAWLASEEIANGKTNGTFAPGANVSRAELATFLERYHEVLTK